MAQTCATRRIKNAKHLQREAPHLLPREEPAQGYTSRIPAAWLDVLHRAVRPKDLPPHPQLEAYLAKARLPRPKTTPSEPLFNGTLIFVQVTFTTAKGTVAVSGVDLATAMNFAQLAVAPISRYASQYGPNGLTVAPKALPFAVRVDGGRYNDQTLQGWVNSLVAQYRMPSNTCLVFLNPQGVVNTDADPSQGVGGYHSVANIPYCFVNVMGTGLTVPDQDGLYALALSHEIAEMTVDPKADLVNPECCDGCGPNCQTAWIDYFDNRGAYIATDQAFPPSFVYAFLINAIVQPDAATQCPAPGSACNYAPP